MTSNKYTEQDVSKLLDKETTLFAIFSTVADRQNPGYLAQCKKEERFDDYLKFLLSNSVRKWDNGIDPANYILFEVRYEDLPLLLRHKDRITSLLVSWRLEIGK